MRELHQWVFAKGYIPACLFSPPLDMSLIHSKVSTSCGKSKAFHCSLYLPPSHTRVPYIQYSIKISFSSYPMNARHALDLRVPRPYMHTHTPPCHLPYSQSWYFPSAPVPATKFQSNSKLNRIDKSETNISSFYNFSNPTTSSSNRSSSISGIHIWPTTRPAAASSLISRIHSSRAYSRTYSAPTNCRIAPATTPAASANCASRTMW